MTDVSPDSCFKGGRFCAPGFRFHPTDEELVVYYLKRKICRRRLRVNVIGVVDVYKWNPEELPGQSLLKSGDRQWFFFTPRSRRYPNGGRSSRGTASGYWKATGKDRTILYNSRAVGVKKTLVFYRGRAPNGERTDWVMHEYTMDEEELGKCQNAKDYYALYKLFKKSGAGPKNGEQYGAPFQEEEWADDGDRETPTGVAEPEVFPTVRSDSAADKDEGLLTHPFDVPLDNIEELLEGIADAPIIPPGQENSIANAIPQVNSEEDIQSTLMNSSSFEMPEQIENSLTNNQQYKRDDVNYSSFASASAFESTEVGMVPNTMEEVAPLLFENEDFIEMDDLLIPDLEATEKQSQLLNTDEFFNQSEFDSLFHDVAMSFDMEPLCQGSAPNPSSFMNDFGNNTSDQTQHHPYHQLQPQTLENQLNNLTDPNGITPNPFSGDFWQQEEAPNLFDDPQSYLGPFASSSSGLTHGPMNSPPPTGVKSTQDQEGQDCPGTTSDFSSTLWAFMESIPTTPASACEGPLNRTFLRMSSFSRIRLKATAKANGASVATVDKKPIRNRGYLLLSILGALCAVFWVFINIVRVK